VRLIRIDFSAGGRASPRGPTEGLDNADRFSFIEPSFSCAEARRLEDLACAVEAVSALHNELQDLLTPVVTRSPSPHPLDDPDPPTDDYTDDGRPILFYGMFFFLIDVVPLCIDNSCSTVRALYDYPAAIDEEFDFEAGDIIAVTDNPEDGLWSGELLDEVRRQAGRHMFPSSFVSVF